MTSDAAVVAPASGRSLVLVLSRHATLVAGAAFAVLLPALWLPVVARTGMAWDTTIVYRSDTTSALDGFLYVGDPLRKFTDVFYQLSYLAGAALGIKGSWVPFHVVYALLWWARGLLVYMIVARLLPRYRGLAFLLGGLAILHSSDKQLNLIGQLNQLGMIFWMLLSVYFYVRAFDARDRVRALLWVAASGIASYLCLWSYEAPLFMMLALPLVLLTLRYGWTRWNVIVSIAFLVMPLVYAYDNLMRYVSGTGGEYQESILKSPITVGPVLSDLWLNVDRSLAFWSWGTGLAGYARPEGTEPLLLGLLEAALFGLGLLVFLRVTRSRVVPPLRTSLTLGGIGFVLLLFSFPAYVILVSSTQLNRTQFLSSIGAALVFGAVALIAAELLGHHHAAAGRVVAGALCSAIAFFSLLGAYSTGSLYNLLWMRQRNVIVAALHAVPRVQPGSVVVLTNVPTDPNPFGDSMWADFALRLAYPGTPVAGVYFFGDGTPGIDSSLELVDGRWAATGHGFPTLFSDVPLHKTVVIRLDGNGGATVAKQLPPFLARHASKAAQYRPLAVVRPGPVSSVARRRYLEP